MHVPALALCVKLFKEDAWVPFWTGTLDQLIAYNREGEDWRKVEDTLRRDGRCWIGGGAAPMVLLVVMN